MKMLFISVPASDYEASTDFYRHAVGLTSVKESADGPHRFTNFDLGGPVLKVFEWRDDWHGTGHSGLFIETDALDDVVRRIRDRGEKTMDIVVHPWGGRCCTVRDPFGNLFDLIDSSMKGDA